MPYQSKTYSLSDEVVTAIEAKRAEGVSPDQYLWSLIFRTQKISKRALAAQERAAGDVTAKAVGRPEIDYSDTDSTPTTHIATLDAVGPAAAEGRGKVSVENWRAKRKPLLKPKERK
jgi:hypothetical protein